MKLFLISLSLFLISSGMYASHEKKEEKSHSKKKDEKKEDKKKEEKKKEEKKKEEPKKEEVKKEEAKKEEAKKPVAPPDPKVVRDFKEQENTVKIYKSYIKGDEKEIDKCKKGKDLPPEEKRACAKNVDIYQARLEKNKLRLKDAELKLRTMEKEAKKRIPPKPTSEHSGK